MGLGDWAEALVARELQYQRVPASGAMWPCKEDLIKEGPDGKFLAQVKATRRRTTYGKWIALEQHAKVEGAQARWYEVLVGPGEVLVFEKRLIKRLRTGIGGEA